MATILSFGKYRNQDISAIYETNPGYCRWVHFQNSLSTSPEIKQFLQGKFCSDDGSHVMTWGKYKGKSIKVIKAVDPNYLEYLKNNQFIKDNQPKLLEELLSL